MSSLEIPEHGVLLSFILQNMHVAANIPDLYIVVLDHKCTPRKFWDKSSTKMLEIKNPTIDLNFFPKTTSDIIVVRANL